MRARDAVRRSCSQNGGCGEAGAIGSPAAVMNAVTDALWHLGVKDVPMPATLHNVWKTIAAVRR